MTKQNGVGAGLRAAAICRRDRMVRPVYDGDVVRSAHDCLAIERERGGPKPARGGGSRRVAAGPSWPRRLISLTMSPSRRTWRQSPSCLISCTRSGPHRRLGANGGMKAAGMRPGVRPRTAGQGSRARPSRTLGRWISAFQLATLLGVVQIARVVGGRRRLVVNREHCGP